MKQQRRVLAVVLKIPWVLSRPISGNWSDMCYTSSSRFSILHLIPLTRKKAFRGHVVMGLKFAYELPRPAACNLYAKAPLGCVTLSGMGQGGASRVTDVVEKSLGSILVVKSFLRFDGRWAVQSARGSAAESARMRGPWIVHPRLGQQYLRQLLSCPWWGPVCKMASKEFVITSATARLI
jgi:hypothetical protein